MYTMQYIHFLLLLFPDLAMKTTLQFDKINFLFIISMINISLFSTIFSRTVLEWSLSMITTTQAQYHMGDIGPCNFLSGRKINKQKDAFYGRQETKFY